MRNLEPKQSSYNSRKVPATNLSSVQSTDISPLDHGLQQCFVDKYKFETLCISVNKDISPDDKENFHELLRSATNAFTQNVYRTKDST